MGSWINPGTYSGIPNVEDPDIPIILNGYKIIRPGYFKNKAAARGFEIALVLAQKKRPQIYSQRMGDIILTVPGKVVMYTPECIDVIMFNGVREIRLEIDAVNARKVAKDAMKYVPDFFETDVVIYDQKEDCRKMWYLEIFRK